MKPNWRVEYHSPTDALVITLILYIVSANIPPPLDSLTIPYMRLAVSRLASPVDGFLQRCNFPEADGKPYHLAVSGGPDSLAMAVLSMLAGLQVEIWHVDHKIRPESADEAVSVASFAEALGVRFHLVSQKVADGSNLEARARNLRKEQLPVGVATGHTMDDQAETLLINLMRGAGLRGLGAMEPGFSKPILGLRRSETKEICRAVGLSPLQDPSNSSVRFLRNRVRHQVVPQMCEVASRDVVPILARTSLILKEQDAFLDGVCFDIDPGDVKRLVELHRVLRMRVVRRAIEALVGYPPSYDALVELDDLIMSKRNFRVQLAGDVDVTCRRGLISYIKRPKGVDPP